MLRKKPRYYGTDERVKSGLKLKPGEMLSSNPDARQNGFDSRNGDIVIKDAEGNVKKVVKNKAVFKQGSREWETVTRAK